MAPWKNPFRKDSRKEGMDRELAFHIDELTKPAQTSRIQVLTRNPVQWT